MFFNLYTLNHKTDIDNLGIMIGRHVHDTYNGGNPWQLTTEVLAEYYYKLSYYFRNKGVDKNNREYVPINNSEAVDKDPQSYLLSEKFFIMGDAILNSLYLNVDNYNWIFYD